MIQWAGPETYFAVDQGMPGISPGSFIAVRLPGGRTVADQRAIAAMGNLSANGRSGDILRQCHPKKPDFPGIYRPCLTATGRLRQSSTFIIKVTRIKPDSAVQPSRTSLQSYSHVAPLTFNSGKTVHIGAFIHTIDSKIGAPFRDAIWTPFKPQLYRRELFQFIFISSKSVKIGKA